jgi:hypothetical protein
MFNRTLFGALSSRFAPHPENLATEALHFLLDSRIAAGALLDLLAPSGAAIREVVRFETQAGSQDSGTPDLIGYDSSGTPRLIIENKFWAGLTENQPVTYFERSLADDGLLLFIVPRKRQEVIWTELLYRMQSADIVMDESPVRDLTFARTSRGRVLAVTNWLAVLNVMSTALDAANERSGVANLDQLRGLCEEMDAKAFLPLRADELTDQSIARRMVNLADLVDRIVGAACSRGIADKSRGIADKSGPLKLTPTRYGTGHYLRVGDYQFWFGIKLDVWAKYGITPIWISVERDTAFSKATVVQEKLRGWAAETPPRAIIESKAAHVPIRLPHGVEETAVKEYALAQLQELDRVLRIGDLEGPEQ